MTTRRRIDDFGEHIPGARKDLLGSIVVGTALDGNLPRKLTEAWPAPPWERLAEMEPDDAGALNDLAFLRAVRDHLRTRRAWENEHWLCRPGQQGGGLLQLAHDVIHGKATIKQAKARIDALTGEWTRNKIQNTTVLYRYAGHAHDLSALRCFERNGRCEIGKPVTGRSGLYRSLGTADTLTEAARKLPEVLARLKARTAEGEKDNSGRCPYEIRWEIRTGETTKRYSVCRRHAGRWVEVYECAARTRQGAAAEALERIRSHRDDLDTGFERWRTLPDARNRSNERRTPPAECRHRRPGGVHPPLRLPRRAIRQLGLGRPPPRRSD